MKHILELCWQAKRTGVSVGFMLLFNTTSEISLSITQTLHRICLAHYRDSSELHGLHGSAGAVVLRVLYPECGSARVRCPRLQEVSPTSAARALQLRRPQEEGAADLCVRLLHSVGRREEPRRRAEQRR